MSKDDGVSLLGSRRVTNNPGPCAEVALCLLDLLRRMYPNNVDSIIRRGFPFSDQSLGPAGLAGSGKASHQTRKLHHDGTVEDESTAVVVAVGLSQITNLSICSNAHTNNPQWLLLSGSQMLAPVGR